MSIALKVKSKHLSAEAGIIRFEEQKLKRQLKYFRMVRNNLVANKPGEDASEEEQAAFKVSLRTANQNINKSESALSSLQNHRSDVVGDAARQTYLARAFLSGKAYRQVENEKTKSTPDLGAITKMVTVYGTGDHARYVGKDMTKVRSAVEKWLNSEEAMEPTATTEVRQTEIAA